MLLLYFEFDGLLAVFPRNNLHFLVWNFKLYYVAKFNFFIINYTDESREVPKKMYLTLMNPPDGSIWYNNIPSGSCVRKSNSTLTDLEALKVKFIKDPIVGKVAGNGASIWNQNQLSLEKSE